MSHYPYNLIWAVPLIVLGAIAVGVVLGCASLAIYTDDY